MQTAQATNPVSIKALHKHGLAGAPSATGICTTHAGSLLRLSLQCWKLCMILDSSAVKQNAFHGNSEHVDCLSVPCRPITSDMVDDQMPLIGIPSFIKPAGPSAVQCTHYFVSVRPTDCMQPSLPNGTPDTAAPAQPCQLPRTTTLSKPTPSVRTPACTP